MFGTRHQVLASVAFLASASACRGDNGLDVPDDLPLHEVERVEIRAATGNVDLIAGEQLSLQLDAAWSSRAQLPTTDLSVVDGVLTIETSCPDSTRVCELRHDLTVPPDVEVIVDVGSGIVFAQRLQGDLSVTVGKGGLLLEELEGSVEAHIDDGDLTAIGLRGSTAALVAPAGALTAVFDAAPLRVDAFAYDRLEVQVPIDDYDLSLDPGLGQVRVWDLDDNDRATRKLLLASATGPLVLRGQTPLP